mgnify:CR=1 FL=1
MSLAEVLLAIMWVGVTMYAIFAGADFGAGAWDLLAGGPEEGAERLPVVVRAADALLGVVRAA